MMKDLAHASSCRCSDTSVCHTHLPMPPSLLTFPLSPLQKHAVDALTMTARETIPARIAAEMEAYEAETKSNEEDWAKTLGSSSSSLSSRSSAADLLPYNPEDPYNLRKYYWITEQENSRDAQASKATTAKDTKLSAALSGKTSRDYGRDDWYGALVAANGGAHTYARRKSYNGARRRML